MIIPDCFSVPPTLLGSGDVKTLTVPLNGHLTLECLADSDLAPDIEWYRDEAKVQVQTQMKFKTIILSEKGLFSDSKCLFPSAGGSIPSASRGSVPGDTGSQA